MERPNCTATRKALELTTTGACTLHPTHETLAAVCKRSIEGLLVTRVETYVAAGRLAFFRSPLFVVQKFSQVSLNVLVRQFPYNRGRTSASFALSLFSRCFFCRLNTPRRGGDYCYWHTLSHVGDPHPTSSSGRFRRRLRVWRAPRTSSPSTSMVMLSNLSCTRCFSSVNSLSRRSRRSALAV